MPFLEVCLPLFAHDGILTKAVVTGPDASLVVLPLRESGKEHHRTLSSLPQICQLASGSLSRFMMSFWEREVRIYKIAPESGADAESQRNQLVGRVLIPVSP